ncbi:SufD family Fe-S cluster assembly protein [Candidatus Shikimatogenerans bostrichidophilus]|uniref:SufD family Fe-S cluster assembly protein n=1 Tax=Candidatus Shikimatogenerans bostrichidophilus TaxID=2943807 RepID=UPI003B3AB15E
MFNNNYNKQIINNFIINILLKKYSEVNYYKYINNKNNLYINNINNIYIYQDYKSKLIIYNIYLNNKYTFNEINIKYINNKCYTRLYNIIILSDYQILENYIKIKNNYNYCDNKIYYIGIYNNNSYCVINGNININKRTIKNISLQDYKNFILSNKVFLFSKPELNIYSNKVICSHGLTLGKIDKNIIYYLATRGLKLKKCKIIFYLSNIYKYLIFKNKYLSYIKKKIINKLYTII